MKIQNMHDSAFSQILHITILPKKNVQERPEFPQDDFQTVGFTVELANSTSSDESKHLALMWQLILLLEGAHLSLGVLI